MSKPKLEIRTTEVFSYGGATIRVYSDDVNLGEFSDFPYESSDAYAVINLLRSLDKAGIIELEVDESCKREWSYTFQN